MTEENDSKGLSERFQRIEHRLTALEDAVNETRRVMNDAVEKLCLVDGQQRDSLAKFAAGMDEENQELFDAVVALREMVDPLYSTVFPNVRHFTDDITRIIGKPLD